VFDQYPKIRQPLPKEYLAIYEEHIKKNRDGETSVTSISQRLEKWLHKKVAEGSAPDLTTLEIGAGTLNQLQYESVSESYDIIEPFKALYENSSLITQIGNIYNLIEDVPLTNRYDRITSCAVFEHVENLPYVVGKSGLLLNDNGQLRVAVPSEGGAFWKIGYTLTTGIEFRIKRKLNYSVIMKYEHINTVDEIESVIKWFYKDVSVKRFGLGKHFSFYTFFAAQNPDIERCNGYLKSQ